MTNWLTLWRVYGIVIIFWCDKLFDVMTYVALIDVMMNILTPWNFLTTSHTFWHPDTLFDLITNSLTRFLSSWQNCSLFWEQNVMTTCFWCYSELFNVIACFWCHDELFLKLWRIFDIPFDTITHYFNLFLNVWRIFDVILNLLTSWGVFDIITCFWRHDKLVDAMANVLTWRRIFDIINFLTLWRTYWRYDVIKLSWQHKHRHNQIHTNISKWWCGQTVCWACIMGAQKHTHTLSH